MNPKNLNDDELEKMQKGGNINLFDPLGVSEDDNNAFDLTPDEGEDDAFISYQNELANKRQDLETYKKTRGWVSGGLDEKGLRERFVSSPDDIQSRTEGYADSISDRKEDERLGNIELNPELRNEGRYLTQGYGEKALNALSRTIGGAALQFVGGLGAMLDFEDYYNTDNEVGNWLSNATGDALETLQDNNPIYESDKSSKWLQASSWLKHGGDLVSSMTAFYGLGMLGGAATGGIASLGNLAKLAEAAKRGVTLKNGNFAESLLSTITSGGAITNLNRAGKMAAIGANAAMMNQAEGIMSAIDTYKTIQEDALNRGYSDDYAKQAAASAAATTVSLNKANMATNWMQASKILKRTNKTFDKIAETGFKNKLKNYAKEAVPEAFEEGITSIAEDAGKKAGQNILDKQLLSGTELADANNNQSGRILAGINAAVKTMTGTPYIDALSALPTLTGAPDIFGSKSDFLTTKDVWNSVDYDKLVESMVLGALGGVGQQAMTDFVVDNLGNSDTKVGKALNYITRGKYSDILGYKQTEKYDDDTYVYDEQGNAVRKVASKGDDKYEEELDLYDTNEDYTQGDIAKEDIKIPKKNDKDEIIPDEFVTIKKGDIIGKYQADQLKKSGVFKNKIGDQKYEVNQYGDDLYAEELYKPTTDSEGNTVSINQKEKAINDIKSAKEELLSIDSKLKKSYASQAKALSNVEAQSSKKKPEDIKKEKDAVLLNYKEEINDLNSKKKAAEENIKASEQLLIDDEKLRQSKRIAKTKFKTDASGKYIKKYQKTAEGYYKTVSRNQQEEQDRKEAEDLKELYRPQAERQLRFANTTLFSNTADNAVSGIEALGSMNLTDNERTILTKEVAMRIALLRASGTSKANNITEAELEKAASEIIKNELSLRNIGDAKKRDSIIKELTEMSLDRQILNSLEDNNLDVIKKMWEELRDMSPEEAIQKGYDSDYKKIAKEKLERIDQLEMLWLEYKTKSKTSEQAKALFMNRLQYDRLRNELKDIESKVTDSKKESSELIAKQANSDSSATLFVSTLLSDIAELDAAQKSKIETQLDKLNKEKAEIEEKYKKQTDEVAKEIATRKKNILSEQSTEYEDYQKYISQLKSLEKDLDILRINKVDDFNLEKIRAVEKEIETLKANRPESFIPFQNKEKLQNLKAEIDNISNSQNEVINRQKDLTISPSEQVALSEKSKELATKRTEKQQEYDALDKEINTYFAKKSAEIQNNNNAKLAEILSNKKAELKVIDDKIDKKSGKEFDDIKSSYDSDLEKLIQKASSDRDVQLDSVKKVIDSLKTSLTKTTLINESKKIGELLASKEQLYRQGAELDKQFDLIRNAKTTEKALRDLTNDKRMLYYKIRVVNEGHRELAKTTEYLVTAVFESILNEGSTEDKQAFYKFIPNDKFGKKDERGIRALYDDAVKEKVIAAIRSYQNGKDTTTLTASQLEVIKKHADKLRLPYVTYKSKQWVEVKNIVKTLEGEEEVITYEEKEFVHRGYYMTKMVDGVLTSQFVTLADTPQLTNKEDLADYKNIARPGKEAELESAILNLQRINKNLQPLWEEVVKQNTLLTNATEALNKETDDAKKKTLETEIKILQDTIRELNEQIKDYKQALIAGYSEKKKYEFYSIVYPNDLKGTSYEGYHIVTPYYEIDSKLLNTTKGKFKKYTIKKSLEANDKKELRYVSKSESATASFEGIDRDEQVTFFELKIGNETIVFGEVTEDNKAYSDQSLRKGALNKETQYEAMAEELVNAANLYNKIQEEIDNLQRQPIVDVALRKANEQSLNQDLVEAKQNLARLLPSTANLADGENSFKETLMIIANSGTDDSKKMASDLLAKLNPKYSNASSFDVTHVDGEITVDGVTYAPLFLDAEELSDSDILNKNAIRYQINNLLSNPNNMVAKEQIINAISSLANTKNFEADRKVIQQIVYSLKNGGKLIFKKIDTKDAAENANNKAFNEVLSNILNVVSGKQMMIDSFEKGLFTSKNAQTSSVELMKGTERGEAYSLNTIPNTQNGIALFDTLSVEVNRLFEEMSKINTHNDWEAKLMRAQESMERLVNDRRTRLNKHITELQDKYSAKNEAYFTAKEAIESKKASLEELKKIETFRSQLLKELTNPYLSESEIEEAIVKSLKANFNFTDDIIAAETLRVKALLENSNDYHQILINNSTTLQTKLAEKVNAWNESARERKKTYADLESNLIQVKAELIKQSKQLKETPNDKKDEIAALTASIANLKISRDKLTNDINSLLKEGSEINDAKEILESIRNGKQEKLITIFDLKKRIEELTDLNKDNSESIRKAYNIKNSLIALISKLEDSKRDSVSKLGDLLTSNIVKEKLGIDKLPEAFYDEKGNYNSELVIAYLNDLVGTSITVDSMIYDAINHNPMSLDDTIDNINIILLNTIDEQDKVINDIKQKTPSVYAEKILISQFIKDIEIENDIKKNTTEGFIELSKSLDNFMVAVNKANSKYTFIEIEKNKRDIKNAILRYETVLDENEEYVVTFQTRAKEFEKLLADYETLIKEIEDVAKSENKGKLGKYQAMLDKYSINTIIGQLSDTYAAVTNLKVEASEIKSQMDELLEEISSDGDEDGFSVRDKNSIERIRQYIRRNFKSMSTTQFVKLTENSSELNGKSEQFKKDVISNVDKLKTLFRRRRNYFGTLAKLNNHYVSVFGKKSKVAEGEKKVTSLVDIYEALKEKLKATNPKIAVTQLPVLDAIMDRLKLGMDYERKISELNNKLFKNQLSIENNEDVDSEANKKLYANRKLMRNFFELYFEETNNTVVQDPNAIKQLIVKYQLLSEFTKEGDSIIGLFLQMTKPENSSVDSQIKLQDDIKARLSELEKTYGDTEYGRDFLKYLNDNLVFTTPASDETAAMDEVYQLNLKNNYEFITRAHYSNYMGLFENIQTYETGVTNQVSQRLRQTFGFDETSPTVGLDESRSGLTDSDFYREGDKWLLNSFNNLLSDSDKKLGDVEREVLMAMRQVSLDNFEMVGKNKGAFETSKIDNITFKGLIGQILDAVNKSHFAKKIQKKKQVQVLDMNAKLKSKQDEIELAEKEFANGKDYLYFTLYPELLPYMKSYNLDMEDLAKANSKIADFKNKIEANDSKKKGIVDNATALMTKFKPSIQFETLEYDKQKSALRDFKESFDNANEEFEELVKLSFDLSDKSIDKMSLSEFKKYSDDVFTKSKLEKDNIITQMYSKLDFKSKVEFMTALRNYYLSNSYVADGKLLQSSIRSLMFDFSKLQSKATTKGYTSLDEFMESKEAGTYDKALYDKYQKVIANRDKVLTILNTSSLNIDDDSYKSTDLLLNYKEAIELVNSLRQLIEIESKNKSYDLAIKSTKWDKLERNPFSRKVFGVEKKLNEQLDELKKLEESSKKIQKKFDDEVIRLRLANEYRSVIKSDKDILKKLNELYDSKNKALIAKSKSSPNDAIDFNIESDEFDSIANMLSKVTDLQDFYKQNAKNIDDSDDLNTENQLAIDANDPTNAIGTGQINPKPKIRTMESQRTLIDLLKNKIDELELSISNAELNRYTDDLEKINKQIDTKNKYISHIRKELLDVKKPNFDIASEIKLSAQKNVNIFRNMIAFEKLMINDTTQYLASINPDNDFVDFRDVMSARGKKDNLLTSTSWVYNQKSNKFSENVEDINYINAINAIQSQASNSTDLNNFTFEFYSPSDKSIGNVIYQHINNSPVYNFEGKILNADKQPITKAEYAASLKDAGKDAGIVAILCKKVGDDVKYAMHKVQSNGVSDVIYVSEIDFNSKISNGYSLVTTNITLNPKVGFNTVNNILKWEGGVATKLKESVKAYSYLLSKDADDAYFKFNTKWLAKTSTDRRNGYIIQNYVAGLTETNSTHGAIPILLYSFFENENSVKTYDDLKSKFTNPSDFDTAFNSTLNDIIKKMKTTKFSDKVNPSEILQSLFTTGNDTVLRFLKDNPLISKLISNNNITLDSNKDVVTYSNFVNFYDNLRSTLEFLNYTNGRINMTVSNFRADVLNNLKTNKRAFSSAQFRFNIPPVRNERKEGKRVMSKLAGDKNGNSIRIENVNVQLNTDTLINRKKGSIEVSYSVYKGKNKISSGNKTDAYMPKLSVQDKLMAMFAIVHSSKAVAKDDNEVSTKTFAKLELPVYTRNEEPTNNTRSVAVLSNSKATDMLRSLLFTTGRPKEGEQSQLIPYVHFYIAEGNIVLVGRDENKKPKEFKVAMSQITDLLPLITNVLENSTNSNEAEIKKDFMNELKDKFDNQKVGKYLIPFMEQYFIFLENKRFNFNKAAYDMNTSDYYHPKVINGKMSLVHYPKTVSSNKSGYQSYLENSLESDVDLMMNDKLTSPNVNNYLIIGDTITNKPFSYTDLLSKENAERAAKEAEEAKKKAELEAAANKTTEVKTEDDKKKIENEAIAENIKMRTEYFIDDNLEVLVNTIKKTRDLLLEIPTKAKDESDEKYKAILSKHNEVISFFNEVKDKDAASFKALSNDAKEAYEIKFNNVLEEINNRLIDISLNSKNTSYEIKQIAVYLSDLARTATNSSSLSNKKSILSALLNTDHKVWLKLIPYILNVNVTANPQFKSSYISSNDYMVSTLSFKTESLPTELNKLKAELEKFLSSLNASDDKKENEIYQEALKLASNSLLNNKTIYQEKDTYSFTNFLQIINPNPEALLVVGEKRNKFTYSPTSLKSTDEVTKALNIESIKLLNAFIPLFRDINFKFTNEDVQYYEKNSKVLTFHKETDIKTFAHEMLHVLIDRIPDSEAGKKSKDLKKELYSELWGYSKELLNNITYDGTSFVIKNPNNNDTYSLSKLQFVGLFCQNLIPVAKQLTATQCQELVSKLKNIDINSNEADRTLQIAGLKNPLVIEQYHSDEIFTYLVNSNQLASFLNKWKMSSPAKNGKKIITSLFGRIFNSLRKFITKFIKVNINDDSMLNAVINAVESRFPDINLEITPPQNKEETAQETGAVVKEPENYLNSKSKEVIIDEYKEQLRLEQLEPDNLEELEKIYKYISDTLELKELETESQTPKTLKKHVDDFLSSQDSNSISNSIEFDEEYFNPNINLSNQTFSEMQNEVSLSQNVQLHVGDMIVEFPGSTYSMIMEGINSVVYQSLIYNDVINEDFKIGGSTSIENLDIKRNLLAQASEAMPDFRNLFTNSKPKSDSIKNYLKSLGEQITNDSYKFIVKDNNGNIIEDETNSLTIQNLLKGNIKLKRWLKSNNVNIDQVLASLVEKQIKEFQSIYEIDLESSDEFASNSREANLIDRSFIASRDVSKLVKMLIESLNELSIIVNPNGIYTHNGVSFDLNVNKNSMGLPKLIEYNGVLNLAHRLLNNLPLENYSTENENVVLETLKSIIDNELSKAVRGIKHDTQLLSLYPLVYDYLVENSVTAVARPASLNFKNDVSVANPEMNPMLNFILINEFTQTFSKVRYDINIGELKGKEFIVFSGNVDESKSAIQKTWKNNFNNLLLKQRSNSNRTSNDSFNRNFAVINITSNFMSDFDVFKRVYGSKPTVENEDKYFEEAGKILASIGIEFMDIRKTAQNLRNIYALQDNAMSSNHPLYVALNNINNMLSGEKGKLIEQLYLEGNRSSNENSSDTSFVLNQIASAEFKTNYSKGSSSVTTADGEQQSAIFMNSYIGRIQTLLNSLSRVNPEDRVAYLDRQDPEFRCLWNNNSLVLDGILNKGYSVKLSMSNGTKSDMVANTASAQHFNDKFLMDFYNLLGNKQMFPLGRSADRPTEVTFHLEDASGKPVSIINTDNVVDFQNSMIEFIKLHLIDEINTIVHFRLNRESFKNIAHYSKNGDKFRLFSGTAEGMDYSKLIDITAVNALIDKLVGEGNYLTPFTSSGNEVVSNLSSMLNNIVNGDNVYQFFREQANNKIKSLVENREITMLNDGSYYDVSSLIPYSFFKSASENGGITKEMLIEKLAMYYGASLVGYTEQFKIFALDPAFFKSTEDAVKRLKLLDSTKKLTIASPYNIDILNANNVIYLHKGDEITILNRNENYNDFINIINNGYKIPEGYDRISFGFGFLAKSEWSKTFNNIIFEDVKSFSSDLLSGNAGLTSADYDNLNVVSKNVGSSKIYGVSFGEGKTFYFNNKGELESESEAGIMVGDLVANFLNSFLLNGMTHELLLTSKLNAYISPYTEITEADGEAYTTLEGYKMICLLSGISWTLQLERSYQQLITGETISMEDYEMFMEQTGTSFTAGFNKLKTQFVGASIYENENTNPTFQNGIPYNFAAKTKVTTTYKHSMTPLIPQFIKGTPLEKLSELMISNDAHYAHFISAQKFGTVTNSNGKTNRFYSEKPNGELEFAHQANSNDIVIQSNYFHDFGIQVEMGTSFKGKVTAGTQARKNLISNLYENGVPITESARQIVSSYNSVQNRIYELARQEMFEEFDIELNVVNNQEILVIKSREKFIKALMSSMSGRRYAKNSRLAVTGLLDNGVTIEMLSNSSEMESVLYSLFNNRVIREKRKGEGAPQVSSVGWELHPRTKSTSTDLKTYRRFKDDNGRTLIVAPAECMIALPLELNTFVDARYNGSLDAFNRDITTVINLMESNNWLHSNNLSQEQLAILKLISIFGFRIPNQGVNSCDSLVIKKFLPTSLGTMIVVPANMTAKAGSDFDIDKLTLYSVNFNEKKLKDGILEVTSYDSENILNNNKEQLQNQILDLQIQIMSMPEQERYIMSPISDAIFTDPALGTVWDVRYMSSTKSELEALGNLGKEAFEFRNKYFSDTLSSDEKMEAYYAGKTAYVKAYNLALGKKAMSHLWNPDFHLKKFVSFLSGKPGVGIGAVNLTGHSLCQLAGVYYNNQMNYWVFNHNTTTVDGKKYGSFGGVTDASGNVITENISGFINACVDVAKDDYLASVNAAVDTLGVLLYMHRAGADVEWLFRFVNQPIIVDYIKRLSSSKALMQINTNHGGKKKKDVFMEMFLNTFRNFGNTSDFARSEKGREFMIVADSITYTINKEKYECLNDLILKADNQSLYAINTTERNERYKTSWSIKQQLKDRKQAYTYETLGKNMSKNSSSYSEEDFHMLDLFIEYVRQADEFRTITGVFSPDTKGLDKSISDNIAAENKRVDFKAMRMFGNVELLVGNATPIGEAFKTVEQGHKTVMQLSMFDGNKLNDVISDITDTFKKELQLDAKQTIALRKELSSDLVTMCIQNYPTTISLDFDFTESLDFNTDRILSNNTVATFNGKNYTHIYGENSLVTLIKDLKDDDNYKNNEFIKNVELAFASESLLMNNNYLYNDSLSINHGKSSVDKAGDTYGLSYFKLNKSLVAIEKDAMTRGLLELRNSSNEFDRNLYKLLVEAFITQSGISSKRYSLLPIIPCDDLKKIKKVALRILPDLIENLNNKPGGFQLYLANYHASNRPFKRSLVESNVELEGGIDDSNFQEMEINYSNLVTKQSESVFQKVDTYESKTSIWRFHKGKLKSFKKTDAPIDKFTGIDNVLSNYKIKGLSKELAESDVLNQRTEDFIDDLISQDIICLDM